MKFISTRGQSPALSFEDTLLTGLAPDGGLYLPDAWPLYSQSKLIEWQHLGYADLAKVVLDPFIQSDVGTEAFATLVDQAYAGFDHPAVAPMKQLDHDLWLMEFIPWTHVGFQRLCPATCWALVRPCARETSATCDNYGGNQRRYWLRRD